MSKTRALCLLAGVIFAHTAYAQEQRWFEVEMIIFSQTPAGALQESFTDSTTPIKPGRAIDLVTPRYQPDIGPLLATLPLCLQQSPVQLSEHFTPAYAKALCIIEQQLPVWAERNLFEGRQLVNTVPFPSHLPPVFTGSGKHQKTPYLADAAALQLGDIANRITRQKDKQLLLHTAWRQAPVTERLAIASRWYSGADYSAKFDYWGQRLPTLTTNSLDSLSTAPQDTLLPANVDAGNNDMLQNVEQLLQLLTANNELPELASTDTVDNASSDSTAPINTLPQQVWQLDGLFKLHLDHYLFVNTEFNLRLPQADKLQTVYVRQSRRVISGEIHYLDHPHLGIVLQIRRYEPPEPDVTPINVTEDLPDPL